MNTFARFLLLLTLMAVLVGAAIAFFLCSLYRVTEAFWAAPWLLYLLPLAGIVLIWVYDKVGKPVAGGNNLVIHEIHSPGQGVPLRIAPLILFGTLWTHLFGGSAGREGTAIQIAGGICSKLSRMAGLEKRQSRILLIASIAAGFGAVFGTPITGAVFAMEVLTRGKVRWRAILPCLYASFVADRTALFLGTYHTQYRIDSALGLFGSVSFPYVDGWLWVQVIGLGILCGLVSFLYVELAYFLNKFWNGTIRWRLLRPAAAGAVILVLVWVLGTRDYLGLGVTTADGTGDSIVNAFTEGGVTPLAWFWKLVFTAITLSAGFKGGEVTPLFFMGATFGNFVAMQIGAPVELFAAMAFVAVFAGATNTPLACAIMGMELFGVEFAAYFLVTCYVAYFTSGNTGIYLAQRMKRRPTMTLEQHRAKFRKLRPRLR